jgi:glycerol-3-phosphate dehydrogenase
MRVALRPVRPTTNIRPNWRSDPRGGRRGLRAPLPGHGGFTVTPRRGELIVFDKLGRRLVRHVLLPVPMATTKGVLIAPTVFGNVMLGPTAVDIERKDDTAATADGIEYLRRLCRRLMPELLEQEVTAIYAGLRAATEHEDDRIEVDAEGHYACVAGIRSTGLTASMSIAEHLRERLASAGLELRGNRPERRRDPRSAQISADLTPVAVSGMHPPRAPSTQPRPARSLPTGSA